MTIDPITAVLVGFLAGLTVGHFWTKEDITDHGCVGCAYKTGEG